MTARSHTYSLRSKQIPKQTDSIEKSSNTTPEVYSQQSANINDFSCTICFEILIEPIKLACTHEFCMPCLKTLIQNKSLTKFFFFFQKLINKKFQKILIA